MTRTRNVLRTAVNGQWRALFLNGPQPPASEILKFANFVFKIAKCSLSTNYSEPPPPSSLHTFSATQPNSHYVIITPLLHSLFPD